MAATELSFTIGGENLDVLGVIGKLRFLSKIQPGEKLNVENLTLVDTSWAAIMKWPPVLVSKAYRHALTSETRKKTLEFVKKITNDALHVAVKCFAVSGTYEMNVGRMVLDSLRESRKGVNAFMETYQDDRMFVSEIEAFRDILDAKIAKLDPQAGSEVVVAASIPRRDDLVIVKPLVGAVAIPIEDSSDESEISEDDDSGPESHHRE